jgi:hypothetical protein
MRPNHSANNPLFKDREPELHAVSGPCFRTDRRALRFMAQSSLPIVRVCEGCGPFRPTLRENRLSSDAPSGSLPAGPHERCRPSTIQSAFGRRTAPTNREPHADFLLTDVKVEHTRERHGAPHAGVLSACAGHRRPRAVEHRLPGWESSSRSTGHPDPTKLRHEAREACSSRGRAPLSGERDGQKPGEASAHHVPRGPLFGLPRERRGRRTNPSAFPTAGTTALHRGPLPTPAEPTATSIFHASSAGPKTRSDAAHAAEKPPW